MRDERDIRVRCEQDDKVSLKDICLFDSRKPQLCKIVQTCSCSVKSAMQFESVVPLKFGREKKSCDREGMLVS